jgi:hypothetical protein
MVSATKIDVELNLLLVDMKLGDRTVQVPFGGLLRFREAGATWTNPYAVALATGMPKADGGLSLAFEGIAYLPGIAKMFNHFTFQMAKDAGGSSRAVEMIGFLRSPLLAMRILGNPLMISLPSQYAIRANGACTQIYQGNVPNLSAILNRFVTHKSAGSIPGATPVD